MESTDTNTGMACLSLEHDRLTNPRRSQTSLLSGNSDDASVQINEVSHC
jgi:hypothetical protein